MKTLHFVKVEKLIFNYLIDKYGVLVCGLDFALYKAPGLFSLKRPVIEQNKGLQL